MPKVGSISPFIDSWWDSAWGECSARLQRSWPKACRGASDPWRLARCRRCRRRGISSVHSSPCKSSRAQRISGAITPDGGCCSLWGFSLRCWSSPSFSFCANLKLGKPQRLKLPPGEGARRDHPSNYIVSAVGARTRSLDFSWDYPGCSVSGASVSFLRN